MNLYLEFAASSIFIKIFILVLEFLLAFLLTLIIKLSVGIPRKKEIKQVLKILLIPSGLLFLLFLIITLYNSWPYIQTINYNRKHPVGKISYQPCYTNPSLCKTPAPEPTPEREVKESKKADINGDGKMEIITIYRAKDCGSCHQNWLAVYTSDSENIPILNSASNSNKSTSIYAKYSNYLKALDSLEVSTDDATIKKIFKNSFDIEQPVRKEGEPMCCPSEFITRTFVWNNGTINEQIQ